VSTPAFTSSAAAPQCLCSAVAQATGIPVSALDVRTPAVAGAPATEVLVEARAANVTQMVAFQTLLALLNSTAGAAAVAGSFSTCGPQAQGLYTDGPPGIALSLYTVVQLPVDLINCCAPQFQSALADSQGVMYAMRYFGLPDSATWSPATAATFQFDPAGSPYAAPQPSGGASLPRALALLAAVAAAAAVL